MCSKPGGSIVYSSIGIGMYMHIHAKEELTDFASSHVHLLLTSTSRRTQMLLDRAIDHHLIVLVTHWRRAAHRSRLSLQHSAFQATSTLFVISLLSLSLSLSLSPIYFIFSFIFFNFISISLVSPFV